MENKTNRLAELSGAAWVSKYPDSGLISDLEKDFKANFEKFKKALTDAGASVSVDSTKRPLERAYLMRQAFDIAKGTIKPSAAPALAGVDIDWTHEKETHSIAAAKAMVQGYRLKFQPAYPTSNHIAGKAVDMTISWSGTLKIKQKDGTTKEISSTPRDGGNTDLHEVGASYGVFKLVSDPPHWSFNGHK